ncbi:SusC/RagA family TonB-linked outer membrane protein [Catalinimonas niigatensis]|uniref:SusC/RagA family TonB-linked outer membrane protein n=1 Tax=Catalinimonas niigatensis TaxID=1397264 RepID=UPI0026664C6B|nr:TonB-dependent receptor [Catalinimonas niigatensis]WPP53710.1 TonB-dependent receptor [Catalinimonas niigatensis]
MEVMDKNISGRVTDGEDNTGLPGVNILAKGTSIGTITDVDGNYNLSVPDETTTLIFSSVGYESEEVEINGRTTINMALMPDIQALSEVVVVGYGEQKKVTVTGSVAAVKGEELVKSPAMNLSNSLAGRIPGVFAVNRSGEPGYDGSGIRIRGSNTLGNNTALIVIDGVPARAGGLERLNPADIESMSVLKDASAAIYGARAANGVILVTTKRGKSGKPELSYSFNQGFAQPTVIPRLADATQFAEMRNELEIYNLPVDEWSAAQSAFRENGAYTRANGSLIEAPYGPDDFELFRNGSDPWGHPNTDWYDATLKTWSPQSRHNIQLNGGSDNFRYLASIGYQNQDAYYKDAATGYKQYDMRINLDGEINDYIKVNFGVLGRQESRFFPTVPAGAIFRMQMRGIPTSPAYWPNGLPGPDIENGQNPVVITTNQTGYDRDTRYYFQTNGSVDITIPGIEGLKFTGTAAIDKFLRNTKRWEVPWYLYTWDGTTIDPETGEPALSRGARGPAEPRLNQGNEDQLNILLGGILTYERTFGDHAFTVLAGTNRETIEWAGFNAFRRYFISDAIDQMFAGGDAERNNGGSAWERARLNYFGRVAYNYQEKYLAEFLWRYDGSYMFPENTRYGFFPGIMAGWVISEENFWKDNINVMDFLKIRGSWGQMGNDNITQGPDGELREYEYLSTYGFSDYITGGQQTKTLFETRVPNNTITWEVANNANIGLEGQLWEGKVFFELDYFVNKRTNILWPRFGSIPQSTGMTLPPENIGEVENRGWEFNIGYNGSAGDFSYNASINGGYAQNKILFWDEAPGAPAWQRTTGKPMYTFQVYEYDGVFRDQAEIDANTIDYSAITNTLRPGDMKYKDLYGPDGVPDGRITPDDQVRTDRTNIPLFQGGINLGARYKSFDLSILLQGALGAQTWIGTGEMGSIGNYLEEIYENRWTIDNPSSEHPRIADRANQYYSGLNNTYWLRSADYLRLKNFEVGYTLPVSISERASINNLRVYVNGLNLFAIDKLDVYDPEVDNANGQYYPQARIINVGATVTF